MGKISFSKRTFAGTTKYKLRQDIMQSLASNKEARTEIRRVFQVANRRIQNIQSKDLISPSVQALHKDDIKGYSKFNMRGSWTDLKREYAKAIGFLQQPTSTATGTREYNKHLMKEYDLSEEEFNLMAKKMNDKILSLTDTDFVEKYLMRYKDFTGELERTVSDVSEQIEDKAKQVEKALDDDIEAVTRTAEAVSSAYDEFQKLFDDFGL